VEDRKRGREKSIKLKRNKDKRGKRVRNIKERVIGRENEIERERERRERERGREKGREKGRERQKKRERKMERGEERTVDREK
jgi:hypothetical protein